MSTFLPAQRAFELFRYNRYLEKKRKIQDKVNRLSKKELVNRKQTKLLKLQEVKFRFSKPKATKI